MANTLHMTELLDLLGLQAMPSRPEELKAAWRSTAQRLHPDKGGSVAEFHAAKEAYDRLLDLCVEVDEVCTHCHGYGKSVVTNGIVQYTLACMFCYGTGRRAGVKPPLPTV